MNRRAQINPRDLALSFGIFLLIFGTVSFFISLVAFNNPNSIDSEQLETYNNTFNVLADYQTQTDSLRTSVEGVTADEGSFGFLNSLIRGAWETLKTLFVTLNFIFVVIRGLNSVFGLPMFFIEGVIAIVVMIITFSILRVIFQRDI